MFIHTVFFWLRDDLSSADREIIDRSYSYALVVMFDDEAGHDAYQVAPVHDRFRDSCARLWRQVRIYDAITIAA